MIYLFVTNFDFVNIDILKEMKSFVYLILCAVLSALNAGFYCLGLWAGGRT